MKQEILTKEFSLAEVLGAISGYLLIDRGFDRIHELIEWVVGSSVFTHQIPYVADDVKRALVKQFPQLNPEKDGLGKIIEWLVVAIKEKNVTVEDWIRHQLEKHYGTTLQVAPIQPFDEFEQPPLITPNIEGKVLIVETSSDEFPYNLNE